MFFEALEPRRLLSVVTVTAKRAAAYEGGAPRYFYIRRDTSDLSAPLSVTYIVGGKAKPGLDYNDIGTRVIIRAGNWLRRVEIDAIDDHVDESNESISLTIANRRGYKIGDPS